jgi:hypothetical protein
MIAWRAGRCTQTYLDVGSGLGLLTPVIGNIICGFVIQISVFHGPKRLYVLW